MRLTPTKVCVHCGAVFAKHPRYSKAQWLRAEFCSNACRGLSRRLDRTLALCACGCGQRVKKWSSQFAPGHNMTGTGHCGPYLKTDRERKQRWVVRGRDGRSYLWARIVMQNEIGRELLPGEVVHHINGDSEDDRPENLQLFASHSDHMQHEWRSGAIQVSRAKVGGSQRSAA